MADSINFLLLFSIMCLLLGVGLNTPFGKVLAIATQYQLVLRGLVANFVIVPCVLTFALQGVPVGPDIVIGLLVLAAAPVAPLAPPVCRGGPGRCRVCGGDHADCFLPRPAAYTAHSRHESPAE